MIAHVLDLTWTKAVPGPVLTSSAPCLCQTRQEVHAGPSPRASVSRIQITAHRGVYFSPFFHMGISLPQLFYKNEKIAHYRCCLYS